jgi:hypothetical protein
MYCSWSKNALSVLAVVTALAGLCVQALAQDDGAEGGFLDVHSSGYSRFEFEGDEIVTFHTNGVAFSYLGYDGTAEELRYNHATKDIEVLGDLQLGSEAGSFHAGRLLYSGNSGYATLQDISGELDGGISYQAQNLEMRFEPGILGLSPEEASGRLNAITAELPRELRLKADNLSYDGDESYSWQLSDPFINGGPGTMDLGHGDVLDISGLEFSCSNIQGKLNGDQEIEEVVLNSLALTSVGLVLAAGKAVVTGDIAEADFRNWSNLVAVLTPVDLKVQLDSGMTSFQAAQALLTIFDEDTFSIEFSGSVVVNGTDISLDTERVTIKSSKDGVSVSAPESVALGFDMSALTELTPIELKLGAGE